MHNIDNENNWEFLKKKCMKTEKNSNTKLYDLQSMGRKST